MAPRNSNRSETLAALPQQEREEDSPPLPSPPRSSQKAVIPAIFAAFRFIHEMDEYSATSFRDWILAGMEDARAQFNEEKRTKAMWNNRIVFESLDASTEKDLSKIKTEDKAVALVKLISEQRNLSMESKAGKAREREREVARARERGERSEGGGRGGRRGQTRARKESRENRARRAQEMRG